MVAPNTHTPQPLSPYVPDELSTDLPTAALQYADCLKAVVVPIDPSTKSPGSILRKGWSEKASGDPSQLERWWTDNPNAGIGIVTGPSNLVVFDLDVEVVPTELYWLKTGLIQNSRPGTERGHYVFRSAQVFRSGKIKVDGTKVGDILSGNRIFVASPTPHSKQGGEYRWVKTGEVPELPPIALTYLTTKAGDGALAQSDRIVIDQFAAKYGGGEQPNAVNWLVDREFKEPASLHDACRDALCWAARESKGGRYSWSEAVAKIKTRAVGAYRSRGDAFPAADFMRSQIHAVVEVANLSETELRERWQIRWTISQGKKHKIGEPVKSQTQSNNVIQMSSKSPTKSQQRAVITAQRNLLQELHAKFKTWFGSHYDLAAIDATLAAAAVERLSGDPLWILIVSGASTAKSETVTRLEGCPRVVQVSTLTTEAALLSATGKNETDSEATGGILRELGASGILVFKDVTSILSMNPSTRGPILAALREIYDGEWHRGKGTDGGSRLHWKGRAIAVGAVTTAWDTHHGVVSEMGDRFVLLRIDSSDKEARKMHGTQAIDNTGDELVMRKELSDLVAKLIENVSPNVVPKLTDQERQMILSAADFAAYARTGVVTDPKGDVIDAHAPEGPARLAKQLTQLFRGACVIGLTRSAAMDLTLRCARDCIPPLRLKVLEDLAAHPWSNINSVRKRLQKPHATINRTIQSLHVLGVVEEREVDELSGSGKPVKARLFNVESSFDVSDLRPMNPKSAGQSGTGNIDGHAREV